MEKRRFMSIRTRLLLCFGVTLFLLLTLLGFVIYKEIKDAVYPTISELSLEILQARTGEISRLIEGYSAEVKGVSKRALLQRGDKEEIFQDLMARKGDINPDFEMIFFADKRGDFVTSNGQEGNISDRDYFQAILLSDAESFISDPMISRSTGEEIFVIAHAVWNEEGEKIGLLASTVLLETLSSIVGGIKIGDEGYGYVVDSKTVIMAHPNPSFRLTFHVLDADTVGYQGLSAIGEKMRQGEASLLRYQNPEGETVVTLFNPIPYTQNWSLGVSIFERNFLTRADDLIRSVLFTMLLMILVILFTVVVLSHGIAKPISLLKTGVARISSGDLDWNLRVETGDEMEELAEAFNKMTKDLKEYIERLGNTMAEKARIEGELQVANKIQSSMLPRSFPPCPEQENLDLFALMTPAKEVGGDFYDFFSLDADRFCFSVGDVSGKGVPAALLMVITRTILRNEILQDKPLAEVFSKTNQMICSDNSEDMFITACMGILDCRTGELEFISAGHNPPLFAEGTKGYELKVKPNLALGVMEDYPYESEKLTLAFQDMLFLYTDGVSEAMNEKGEPYGEERLLDAFSLYQDQEPKVVVGKLEEAIAEFCKDTPASDDITMMALCLRRKGNR